jgi:hypothetical protein
MSVSSMLGGVYAIDMKNRSYPANRMRSHAPRLGRTQVAAVVLLFALISMVVFGDSAFAAGKSGTGEPLFYPCTSCHPTVPGAASTGLPNDFKGHRIVLGEHAWVGTGGEACTTCHDDPARDPGMLKRIDGSLVDITGDVSSVCYRCHSAMYKEWQAGIHGNRERKCTASGCHDPHTPGFISAKPLLPFTGSGFQAQVRPNMAMFVPLAGPPPVPAIENPRWLAVLSLLAFAYAGGATIVLVRGRSKR